MTADYIAITRLQAAYADVVTRRAWAELPGLFTPEALIRIDTVTRPLIELSGPDELAVFVGSALERFDFFEFVILNTVIDVNDDRTAQGRLYIEEVRHESDSDEWSHAFGVYQDRYVDMGSGWRFAERSYRSLARRRPSDSEILSAPDWFGQ